jgi:hypothetical protein
MEKSFMKEKAIGRKKKKRLKRPPHARRIAGSQAPSCPCQAHVQSVNDIKLTQRGTIYSKHIYPTFIESSCTYLPGVLSRSFCARGRGKK